MRSSTGGPGKPATCSNGFCRWRRKSASLTAWRESRRRSTCVATMEGPHGLLCCPFPSRQRKKLRRPSAKRMPGWPSESCAHERSAMVPADSGAARGFRAAGDWVAVVGAALGGLLFARGHRAWRLWCGPQRYSWRWVCTSHPCEDTFLRACPLARRDGAGASRRWPCCGRSTFWFLAAIRLVLVVARVDLLGLRLQQRAGRRIGNPPRRSGSVPSTTSGFSRLKPPAGNPACSPGAIGDSRLCLASWLEAAS